MANYSKASFSEIGKIASEYKIQVTDFKPIEGGNANSNYYIQSEENEYVVTICEEKNFDESLKLAKLLLWLRENKFPTSEILKSTDNKLITGFKGKPVMLKKWISGNVGSNLNSNMFMEIGSALSQLHTIAIPDFVEELAFNELDVFSMSNEKEVNLEYKNWLNDRIQFLKDVLPRNIPKGLIHGDLFFDNVLFEHGKLKAIIDFEDACSYYLMYDLGMAILGQCTVDGQFNLDSAKNILIGYEQIRKLENLEKMFLKEFIELAAISTSWWRYWKYNIHSPNPELKNKYMQMVNLANEINGISKEEFRTLMFL